MPLQDGYFTTKIGTKIEHAYTEHNPDGTAYNVFKIKVYLKQKMNVDKITLHLANPVQIANFDNVDGVTTDYSYFNHENSEIEINNINSRYATVTELRNALHTYKANTHDVWCNARNFEGTDGRQAVQLNYCHHYRGMRHDEFSSGLPNQTTTSLSTWKGTYAYIPNTNIWVSANGNKQISNNIRISSKANTIKTINTYSGIDFSGSNTMRLSSEGKIGIGTNLPESEIEVIGSDMTGRGSIKISKPYVTTSEVVLTDDVYNTYASKHNQRIERDISGSNAIPVDFTLNNRKTDTITVYWKSNSLFQNFKITEIVINDILNTSYEISPILEINNITQNNSEYQDWSGGLLMNNEIKWDNEMYRTVKPYTKIYDGYSVELENEIFEYFTIQIKLKQPSEVNKLTLYMHGIGDRLMDYVTRVDVDTNRTMFYPLDGYDVSLAFTNSYPVDLPTTNITTTTISTAETTAFWPFNLNTKNTTEINIYWYNNQIAEPYFPISEIEINDNDNTNSSSPIESITNFANGKTRTTWGAYTDTILFNGEKKVTWTIEASNMNTDSYETQFLTMKQRYFYFNIKLKKPTDITNIKMHIINSSGSGDGHLNDGGKVWISCNGDLPINQYYNKPIFDKITSIVNVDENTRDYFNDNKFVTNFGSAESLSRGKSQVGFRYRISEENINYIAGGADNEVNINLETPLMQCDKIQLHWRSGNNNSGDAGNIKLKQIIFGPNDSLASSLLSFDLLTGNTSITPTYNNNIINFDLTSSVNIYNSSIERVSYLDTKTNITYYYNTIEFTFLEKGTFSGITLTHAFNDDEDVVFWLSGNGYLTTILDGSFENSIYHLDVKQHEIPNDSFKIFNINIPTIYDCSEVVLHFANRQAHPTRTITYENITINNENFVGEPNYVNMSQFGINNLKPLTDNEKLQALHDLILTNGSDFYDELWMGNIWASGSSTKDRFFMKFTVNYIKYNDTYLHRDLTYQNFDQTAATSAGVAGIYNGKRGMNAKGLQMVVLNGGGVGALPQGFGNLELKITLVHIGHQQIIGLNLMEH